MDGRRAGTTAVAVVVAGVLLVVLLATWASSIGPSGVLRGEGIGPIATPTESVSASEDTADASEVGEEHPDIEVHAWVKLVWLVLNIALAVLLVLLLVRYLFVPLVRRGRARRERLRTAIEPEFEVLDPPQRVARALLDDADVQRRELAENGSPRNAVVECWHRFETAAAAAGLQRRPWETSAEFTLRVLDLVDAYEPAVARLADLYREARFSEHDLTEADRDAALEALDTIHRTIGVRA